ncbi:hypothetical protein LGV61_07740 [Desulfurispirillum indicum]|uniref:hypothetical protein n=1 Tax=Desulfurispirillum indicum TaxID=936456 RepID=UPI001CFA7438|nr:hypothetical protein [Desulfurispirillum indicum]UCZ55622.1 hypothetical protein LGV61_07740 [Desulfurispirillum indicum]
MKIRLEHQNIGAAVMQFAEHEQFTAINALKLNGKPVSNAFLINSHVAVLCKYATAPNATGEYVFTFTKDQMNTLASLLPKHDSLFFGLVCVEAGEICCLTKAEFEELLDYRKESAGKSESQYAILVTLQVGSSFRVYVNAAGRKGKYAFKQYTVHRKAFPNRIFG